MKRERPQMKRFAAGIGYGWYPERKKDVATLHSAGLRTSEVFNTREEAEAHAANVLKQTGVTFRVYQSF